MEFEVAVNTELSAQTASQGDKSSGSPPNPQPLAPSGVLAVQDSFVKKPAGSKSGQQLFDIDSLNEIKKANDLASKKVEITNQVFDMLVNEIRNNLFPTRDEEEVGEDGQVQSKAAKKKRKREQRVKKPNAFPKIKEIKNGAPVDMCLKRIQVQAKFRQSLGSVEQCASLSATQSLSASKEDAGVSYLDQTKSKE